MEETQHQEGQNPLQRRFLGGSSKIPEILERLPASWFLVRQGPEKQTVELLTGTFPGLPARGGPELVSLGPESCRETRHAGSLGD